MDKTPSPSYGIDAPIVIINLFIFSVIQTGFVLLSMVYLATYPPALYYGSILLNGIGAFYCFSTALLMLLSSKKTKISFIKSFIQNLPLKGNEKILDVGCGSGLLSIEIAKRLTEGKVYGIDIWQGKDQSRNQAEKTLLNAQIEGVDEKIEIVTADMRSMPFDSAYFDVVVACLAIHNVENREDREAAIQEIARVLKPGGSLYIIDFIYTSEYAALLKALGFRAVSLSKRIWKVVPSLKIVSASR